MANYSTIMRSGFDVVPEALEMESLYGECDHFVSYSPGAATVWQTTTVIEGRYELTLECKVKLNGACDAVAERLTSPTFHLNEITKVEVLTAPDGRAVVTYRGDHVSFGADDWQRLIAAKGDLAVLNVSFKRGQSVPNVDEYIKQTRRDRVRIRPPQLPDLSAPAPNPPKD